MEGVDAVSNRVEMGQVVNLFCNPDLINLSSAEAGPA